MENLLPGTTVKVQNIFELMNSYTNFKIIDNEFNELWLGTELIGCEYRYCDIEFIRVVGCPYSDGFIELKLHNRVI